MNIYLLQVGKNRKTVYANVFIVYSLSEHRYYQAHER